MAVRETQVAVETVAMSTGGKVRVSELVTETVMMNTGGRVRLTLLAVETIGYYIPGVGFGTPQESNVCVIC